MILDIANVRRVLLEVIIFSLLWSPIKNIEPFWELIWLLSGDVLQLVLKWACNVGHVTTLTHGQWRPTIGKWWEGDSRLGSSYNSSYIDQSAELALQLDRSRPIVSVNMELGAERPPHHPPLGGEGREGEGRVRKGTLVHYRVSFNTTLSQLRGPVEVFWGTSSSWTNLRVQFAHRKPRSRILILEEGNQPHPRCSQCGMFVPREALYR